MNLALKALGSNSSGSVDPSLTVGAGGVAASYAYQFWVDTSGSSPILKIRNAANNAWIVLGPVDTASFGFNTTLVATASPTAVAYQFWVDTTNNLLKIRNAANNAWITVGTPSATNLGLASLSGGTFTGAVTFSNTDYIQLPVGTTAQRPGSPVVGMIRYNTDLTTYEGYKAGAWAPIGGGGGGGGITDWIEGDNSPAPTTDTMGNRVYAYSAGLAQVLSASLLVPSTYTAGSPIKLKMPFYQPDSSGTVLFQTVATLIRPGTTAYNSTTNQRTSTNTAVTMSGGVANVPQSVTFDLTSTSGQINGVSLQAGDIIYVNLVRGTDTATSDAQLLAYLYELTYT